MTENDGSVTATESSAVVPLPSDVKPAGLDTTQPTDLPAPQAVAGSHENSEQAIEQAMTFGRVDDDGNIFVTLPTGDEHYVGQWAAGDVRDGLRTFAVRYYDIIVKVDLTGRRLAEGKLSPDEAMKVVDSVRAAALNPTAVGDYGALADRVHQLETLIDVRRVTLAEELAERKATALAQREALADEAEQLSSSTAWRKTSDRYKQMVDEWKTIPQFDRETEQGLWQRLSAARSSFDKARRIHQAEMEKKQADAKRAKEKIVKKAEEISTSQEWNETRLQYRELMNDWKAAGFAGKPHDDELWKKFRAAQDAFFSARKAVFDARDKEQQDNLAKKIAIVEQAEALLPVKNFKEARRAFRKLQGDYYEIGFVPRADKPKVDGRLAKVDTAIKKAENEQWKRSDPEKSARASSIVALYEKSIDDLTEQLNRAKEAGKDTTKLEADLQAQQELLNAARKYA